MSLLIIGYFNSWFTVLSFKQVFSATSSYVIFLWFQYYLAQKWESVSVWEIFSSKQGSWFSDSLNHGLVWVIMGLCRHLRSESHRMLPMSYHPAKMYTCASVRNVWTLCQTGKSFSMAFSIPFHQWFCFFGIVRLFFCLCKDSKTAVRHSIDSLLRLGKEKITLWLWKIWIETIFCISHYEYWL